MRRPPFRPTRRAVAAGLGLTLVSLPGRVAAAPAALELRAAPAPRRLRPDAAVDADVWSLAAPGTEAGPVIRLAAGREFRARLANDTPRPLSLHWHGLRGPNAVDGVGGLTQDPVAPGARSEIAFTPPEPGTILIRPCVIGGSAEPAARGIGGLLIVEEAEPPRVDRDVAVIVDDWLTVEDGALAPFDAVAESSGRLGNWLTVGGGGTPERIEAAPGARLRLRLANACNARLMVLHFEGLRPWVAAIDGQPTETFEPLRGTLPFPPGTRYDLFVDLPAEAGVAGTVVAALGNVRPAPLLTLAAAGAPRAPLPPLAALPPNRSLPAAIRLQNAVRKDLLVRMGDVGRKVSEDSGKVSDPSGGKAWSINDRPGSAAAPLFSVKKGQPVVLALKNETSLPQPFHLHGHVFRLLHPFDDGWEPYFLDTILVPENRTLRIAFNADNPGKWLIASSVLERFDGGLWTWFRVT